MVKVKGAVDVYVSDFGTFTLDGKQSERITPPARRAPRWFYRLFRPSVYKEIIKAECHEEIMVDGMKAMFEDASKGYVRGPSS